MIGRLVASHQEVGVIFALIIQLSCFNAFYSDFSALNPSLVVVFVSNERFLSNILVIR